MLAEESTRAAALARGTGDRMGVARAAGAGHSHWLQCLFRNGGGDPLAHTHGEGLPCVMEPVREYHMAHHDIPGGRFNVLFPVFDLCSATSTLRSSRPKHT